MIEWLDESQFGYEIYLARDNRGTVMCEVSRHKLGESYFKVYIYGEISFYRFGLSSNAKRYCEQQLAHRFAKEICNGDL